MKQKLIAIVLVCSMAAVYYGALAEDEHVEPAAVVAVSAAPLVRYEQVPPVVPMPTAGNALPQARPETRELNVNVPTIVGTPPRLESREVTVRAPIIVGTTPAQNRYLQVQAEYAKLLTDEELEEEIKQLERAISLRNAEQRLESVRGSLEQLIEEFPDTETARKAKRMLDARLDQNPIEPIPVERRSPFNNQLPFRRSLDSDE